MVSVGKIAVAAQLRESDSELEKGAVPSGLLGFDPRRKLSTLEQSNANMSECRQVEAHKGLKVLQSYNYES